MLKNDFLCFMLLGSKEHSDCLKVDLNAAKAKSKKKLARDLKNLCILPENSAKGVGFRRELLHLPPKSCRNFT